MNRQFPLALLLLASCGERTYTAEQCRALAEPEAFVNRCTGGDLASGKYIGDLKCWPFSEPERMAGVWMIGQEASHFYPDARKTEDVNDRRSDIWLGTDLLNRRPDLLAAGQGAGTQAYWIDFIGRRSLCDGMFGHFGMYPHQVIVERFSQMRRLELPAR